MNDIDLVYDEKKVKEAKKIMEEIKNDLYEADCLLYDGVMKVAYAKGIDDVTRDNTSINLNMPEQLMINARESTKIISDTISSRIDQIQEYQKNRK